MITRTPSRWLMSVTLAVFTLVAINFLVATSSAQGRHAATLINCSGSIQACIDAANDGDTILIAAGRYTESLTLSKPVSMTGENRDTTIIHAVANQRVLTVTGATISNSVVISRLTFTGGIADFGGGVLLTNAAQPLVRNSIMFGNIANADGGGLYANNGIALINVDFISNAASVGGGGLYANDAVALTNVDFVSSIADGGGEIYATRGPINVSRGRFEQNAVKATAEAYGSTAN